MQPENKTQNYVRSPQKIWWYRLCFLSTLRCIRKVCRTVCSLILWEQPHSRIAVGSWLWVGPLGQSSPLCLRTRLGFSLAPRNVSQPVNHNSRPSCDPWPTGTLAMATQIPVDFDVKNRSSQKYERQASLIQCRHTQIMPWIKMSWPYE